MLNGFIVRMELLNLINQGFLLKMIRHLKQEKTQSVKEFFPKDRLQSKLLFS